MVLAVSLLVLGARDAGQHRRTCPSVSHHHQQSPPPCKAKENSQYSAAKGKAEPCPTITTILQWFLGDSAIFPNSFFSLSQNGERTETVSFITWIVAS